MARLSLGWLKPPKFPSDGVMSLADHLRELRYRLVLSMVVIGIGVVLCLIYNQQLQLFLMHPYYEAMDLLQTLRPNLKVEPVLDGVTAPLFLVLMVAGLGGLMLTSPVWLYQVWAYLAPALLAKEKKYALAFLGAAVPLFLGGIALGYYVLPSAIAIMLSFTPEDFSGLNLLKMNDFIALMVQLMLVFGLGFLLPVIVVTLNFVGVVSARALKSARRYVLFACAIFGAAATPGGDPFSMMALAIPMMMLFLGAEAICHVHDRRKAKRQGSELAQA